MDRKCPYCKASVPANSLTCPSCYKEVPRDADVKAEPQYEYTIHDDDQPQYEYKIHEERHRSKKIAMFLSFIPGVFGLMGLGLMYLGAWKRGALFFIIGLPLMIMLALLISSAAGLSLGWAILSVGAMLIVGVMYIGVFILQVMATSAAAVFHR